VAQDAVIREPDCGSERGIRHARHRGRGPGRGLARLPHPRPLDGEDLVAADGSIIVPQGTMIEESTSRRSPPPASRR
jgi:DNA-directed RNA polymerase subunit beta'